MGGGLPLARSGAPCRTSRTSGVRSRAGCARRDLTRAAARSSPARESIPLGAVRRNRRHCGSGATVCRRGAQYRGQSRRYVRSGCPRPALSPFKHPPSWGFFWRLARRVLSAGRRARLFDVQWLYLLGVASSAHRLARRPHLQSVAHSGARSRNLPRRRRLAISCAADGRRGAARLRLGARSAKMAGVSVGGGPRTAEEEFHGRGIRRVLQMTRTRPTRFLPCSAAPSATRR